MEVHLEPFDQRQFRVLHVVDNLHPDVSARAPAPLLGGPSLDCKPVRVKSEKQTKSTEASIFAVVHKSEKAKKKK